MSQITEGFKIGYTDKGGMQMEPISEAKKWLLPAEFVRLLGPAITHHVGLYCRTKDEKFGYYEVLNKEFSQILEAILPDQEVKTNDPEYLAFLIWKEKYPEAYYQIGLEAAERGKVSKVQREETESK